MVPSGFSIFLFRYHKEKRAARLKIWHKENRRKYSQINKLKRLLTKNIWTSNKRYPVQFFLLNVLAKQENEHKIVLTENEIYRTQNRNYVSLGSDIYLVPINYHIMMMMMTMMMMPMMKMMHCSWPSLTVWFHQQSNLIIWPTQTDIRVGA